MPHQRAIDSINITKITGKVSGRAHLNQLHCLPSLWLNCPTKSLRAPQVPHQQINLWKGLTVAEVRETTRVVKYSLDIK